jgi:hypothetical protein
MADDLIKINDDEFLDPQTGEVVQEEVKDLMENYDVDKDTAEKAQELVDEGLDESDAVEIAGEM